MGTRLAVYVPAPTSLIAEKSEIVESRDAEDSSLIVIDYAGNLYHVVQHADLRGSGPDCGGRHWHHYGFGLPKAFQLLLTGVTHEPENDLNRDSRQECDLLSLRVAVYRTLYSVPLQEWRRLHQLGDFDNPRFGTTAWRGLSATMRRLRVSPIAHRGNAFFWTLASLSLSMLMPLLDTSIANAALPALAQAFTASFQEVQWIVLAYCPVARHCRRAHRCAPARVP